MRWGCSSKGIMLLKQGKLLNLFCDESGYIAVIISKSSYLDEISVSLKIWMNIAEWIECHF